MTAGYIVRLCAFVMCGTALKGVLRHEDLQLAEGNSIQPSNLQRGPASGHRPHGAMAVSRDL